MRYVERPAAIPAILRSKEIVEQKALFRGFFKNLTAKKSSQEKPYYKPLSPETIAELNNELVKVFHGRCAYCEGPVVPGKTGCFDHFRPVNGARGHKREYSPVHYWWLAFTWENLYLACEDCNKYKSNWFPVTNRRCVKETPYKKILASEKAILLDPCVEPQARVYFGYTDDGKIFPVNDQANHTAEILNLNRTPLVTARRKAAQPLVSLRNRFGRLWSAKRIDVNEAKEVILNLIPLVSSILNDENNSPYISIQLALLNGWTGGRNWGDKELYYYFVEGRKPKHVDPELFALLDKEGHELGDLIRKTYGSDERRAMVKDVEVLPEYSRSDTREIYLEKIIIKNFKGIRDLSVDFPPSTGKNESWMMMLGENGVGKSCFLKAVAMTLMGNEKLKKMNIRPKDVLTHGATTGSVEIYVSGKVELIKGTKDPYRRALTEPIVLDLDNKQSLVTSNLSRPGTFLLAYGATRLFPSKTLKAQVSRGMIRAGNLFDPGVAMRDGKEWLLKIQKSDPGLFDKTCVALKDILMLQTKDRIVVKKGNVFVELYNPKAKKWDRSDELDELSDGYRSVIAVGLDIMSTLQLANTPFDKANGIVLLDEIGTHLHPRWRMEVVSMLRKAFPYLQFIVTTHDPLCLRGLKKGEVVVLEKLPGGGIIQLTNLPDPSELRVEQLLSSEFFGLKSTIDPDMEKVFNEYYELLRRSDGRLDKTEKLRLSELKTKLSDSRHLGNSLREELAFEAADRVLADQQAEKKPKDRSELKTSTVNLLRTMWTEISTTKSQV